MIGIVRRWGARDFGFIRSDELEREAFFHADDIATRDWLPQEGDDVVFEPVRLPDGRVRASNVALRKEAPTEQPTKEPPSNAPIEPVKLCETHAGGEEQRLPSLPPPGSAAPPAPATPAQDELPIAPEASATCTEPPSAAGPAPKPEPPARSMTLTEALTVFTIEGRREEKRLKVQIDDLQSQVHEHEEVVEDARKILVEAQRRYDREQRALDEIQEKRKQLAADLAVHPEHLKERRQGTVVRWFQSSCTHVQDWIGGRRKIEAEMKHARESACERRGADTVEKYDAARSRAKTASDPIEREAFADLEAKRRGSVEEYAQTLDRLDAAATGAVPLVVVTPESNGTPTLMVASVPTEASLKEEPFWRLTSAFCEIIDNLADKGSEPEIGVVHGCLAARLHGSDIIEFLETAIADAWRTRPSLQATGLQLKPEFVSEELPPFDSIEDSSEPAATADPPAGGSLIEVARRTGLPLHDLIVLAGSHGVPTPDDTMSKDWEETLQHLLHGPARVGGEQGAPAAGPESDPSTPKGMAALLLSKMLRQNLIGARHTRIQNVYGHGVPDHLKDLASRVMQHLVKIGILLDKLNEGSPNVSINPRRLQDVGRIIEGTWEGALA
jgi:cold shock CspA family protein